jgi:hypothetical protein
LTVIGPEQFPGDVWGRYNPITPEGQPGSDDESPFAILHRRLESIVRSRQLKGPYGDNHPAVYAWFQYLGEFTPAELLTLLSRNEISVKIRKVPHNGDEAEVLQIKKDFGLWIDDKTVFSPNPNIEILRKQEEGDRELKARIVKMERLAIAVLVTVILGTYWFPKVVGALIILAVLPAWYLWCQWTSN